MPTKARHPPGRLLTCGCCTAGCVCGIHCDQERGPVMQTCGHHRLIEAAPALEDALDQIGGQAYDFDAYGEDELRIRLRECMRIARAALILTGRVES